MRLAAIPQNYRLPLKESIQKYGIRILLERCVLVLKTEGKAGRKIDSDGTDRPT